MALCAIAATRQSLMIRHDSINEFEETCDVEKQKPGASLIAHCTAV